MKIEILLSLVLAFVAASPKKYRKGKYKYKVPQKAAYHAKERKMGNGQYKCRDKGPNESLYKAKLPDEADYRLLYDLLANHVGKESDNIPHWLRVSFHDLANFNGKTGGPHGCMKSDPVRSMAQNKQLKGTVRQINMLVYTSLPNIAFPFGDVLSMAGKVAAEAAYPCIRIKWRPGRPPCGPEEELAPSGSFQTYADIQAHLDWYGFSRKEFAVLIAGSHGVKDAVVHLNQKEIPWVSKTSGVDFIKNTLAYDWTIINGNSLELETPMTHIFRTDQFVRIPSDLMFFPSVVNKAKKYSRLNGVLSEPEAISEENFLKTLITEDQFKFNSNFADVYSKMLEIGVNGSKMGPWYNDMPNPHVKAVCPLGWYYAKIANIP